MQTIRGSGELFIWAHRDDVVIDGTTIGSDGFWGIAGEAGFGVAINREYGLAVLAWINVDGRFFFEDTLRDFENDRFDGHG